MSEYPIYVLSRHELGGGGLEEGHPCCVCTDEPPKEKVNPPVYGYEVNVFIGLENAKPENILTGWGEQSESPETVAGGPDRSACVAYLRLIQAERVQDFTVDGASWSDAPKHWSEL